MTERKKLTKAERQAVYDKMEGHCAYCGCEISLQTMRVDHIVPLRKGGPDTMDKPVTFYFERKEGDSDDG